MSGELYYPLYLIVLTVITIIQYNKYQVLPKYSKGFRNSANTSLYLAIAMVLFIGLRPNWYGFIDSRNYINWYNMSKATTFVFNLKSENILFDNLYAFFCSYKLGWQFFFLLIACVYFICAWKACSKMFRGNALAAFVVYLAAFSTFSYATNGIKAGAAGSIFLLAMAYRDNLKKCIPLIIVSFGFHHSMQLPAVVFIITLLCKNPKVYFWGWAMCLLVAFFHITFFQNLFASMTDERGAEYLLSSSESIWGGKSGFRIDFVIYSAMPVIVGYYILFKKKLRISKFYASLLNLYMGTNSVWMLCMYASFTNRIAYLSWFLYPVVLIYPFLNENLGPSRYRTFSKIMLAHLGFTLFMQFVYYGN